MKRLLFKTLSLALVFFHLFTIGFKDAAFAKPAPSSGSSASQKSPPVKPASTAKNNSSASTVKSKDSSSSQSNRAVSTTSGLDNSVPQNIQSGAASFNVSALQAFQNDPFTGKASFSLPISVAPGRRGIQPNIALTYSSGGGNGIAGLGWDLSLGAIERSTKRGAPKYDSTDTFIFNSGSPMELVQKGGNEYCAKIEGGFMKFEFDGTNWMVTDKNGTKYYFGRTDASRQEDSGRVF